MVLFLGGMRTQDRRLHYVLTYTHTYTLKHTHTYSYPSLSFVSAEMCARKRVVHIYIHTYTHTYTHIRTPTRLSPPWVRRCVHATDLSLLSPCPSHRWGARSCGEHPVHVYVYVCECASFTHMYLCTRIVHTRVCMHTMLYAYVYVCLL